MKRAIGILSVVIAMLVLQVAEARAGAVAGALWTSFTGPAFSATVVLNADSVTDPSSCTVSGAACPSQGTVAIQLSKGGVTSGAIFADGYVASFANGCDGTNGATIVSGHDVVAKTDARFLGVAGWIPNVALTALLAPFGATSTDAKPLVFSDISNPVCTKVDGVWILSFTGTMQFGKKQ